MALYTKYHKTCDLQHFCYHFLEVSVLKTIFSDDFILFYVQFCYQNASFQSVISFISPVFKSTRFYWFLHFLVTTFGLIFLQFGFNI